MKTIYGDIALLYEDDLKIKDSNQFLETIYSTSCDTIVFSKENFPDKFYDLKSGFAGEILQKVSNYKLRVIILGDFSEYTSKSFKDFLYESNKTGKFIFTDNLESGIALLKKAHF